MSDGRWSQVIERYICDGCGEDWNDGRCTCDESPSIQPVEFVRREEAEDELEGAERKRKRDIEAIEAAGK